MASELVPEPAPFTGGKEPCPAGRLELSEKRINLKNTVRYESSVLAMHVDQTDASKLYFELQASELTSTAGIQFLIAALEAGDAFSHLQDAGAEGAIWVLRLASDGSGAEVLRTTMADRVDVDDLQEYKQMWEDGKLPGLREKLPIVGRKYRGTEDCTAVEAYWFDASSLMKAGFHALPSYSWDSTLATSEEPRSAILVSTLELSTVKAFAHNLDFTVSYSNLSPEDLAKPADPENENALEAVRRFCISALPKDKMIGRRADDRAGYFFTRFRLLADLSGEPEALPGYGKQNLYSPTINLINRMRFPSRCAAELNRDANTLHFYVDPTVPKAMWEATRNGIERWQDAFAPLGKNIKGHVLTDKDWPENYDVADNCFNTISWVSGGGGIFAIGQVATDPRTGEVLKANIGFTLGWLGLYFGRNIIYGAMRASAELQLDARRLLGQEVLSFDTGDEEDVDFESTFAERPGTSTPRLWHMATNPTDEQSLDFLQKAIADVTAHEVGHTLGLRHNFRGSVAVTFEEAQQTEKVLEQGLTASVMDYTAVNVISESKRSALKAKFGVDKVPDASEAFWFTPVIGAYDKWVIRYGYTDTDEEKDAANRCKRGWCPGDAKLQAIANEYDKAGFEFMTDETADDFDPYNIRDDMSKDPLDHWEEMMQVGREGFFNLFKRNMDQFKPWTSLWTPFRVLMRAIHGSAKECVSFIGGVRPERKHGDSNQCGTSCQKKALAAVSEADQMRALDLVLKAVTSSKFDPPEWFQREAVKQTATSFPTIYDVVPVNVAAELTTQKTAALKSIFDVERLQRVRLCEQLLKLGEGHLLAEMFRRMSVSLFFSDRTAAELANELRTTRGLHDTRAAYISLLTGYTGSDRIIVSMLKAEASQLASKLQAAAEVAQDVESYFLKSQAGTLQFYSR